MQANLTDRERSLVHVLAQARGAFVPSARLADRIGVRPVGLAPLISRLRPKLVGAEIVGKRGRGYQLNRLAATWRSDLAPLHAPIGRQADLERLATALRPGAVVTVVGPPGVGKTTLARAAAAAADRAWFAPLADCDRPAGLEPRIASTLGVRSPAEIGGILGQDGVLVLDNCEHLARPVAELIASWARAPRRLTILCTSRQLVGAPHEHPLHLGPLDEASATELFLATAARGGRDLGAELEAVRHIVAQLDGLPLAVELTATRAAEGPLEVIRDALGNAPGETLRGAFEGSWRLLGDAERHALIACTVFVGGFTVAAAEAVVPGPGVLRSLRTLHAHSLLTAETDRFHTPRLAMLEVIRQLATERGSEAAMTAARSAHAAYYASLGRPFQGFYPRRPAAYEACVADIPNAAAAARFAAGRDPAAVIGAVHYASTTAQIGENLSEELDELAACAARDQGDLDAELTTRIGETSFLLVRGQPAAAVEHARSLVARARAASPQTLRGTLRNLGFLFFAMDDGETAASVFDEMLACDVGPGGPPDFGTSAAAKNLARLGRVDEADRLLQAYDAAIWTDTIQRSWVARVRVVLATARGHIGQAIGHAEDALDVQRRAGAWCDAAGSAGKLCWLWFVRGAPDRAARYGADGVACADRGVPPWIAAQAQAVALLAVEPDGVAEALGGLPSLIAEVKARVGRRSLGALHALLLAWAGDTDRAAAALPPDDLPELSYLRALAATGVTAARGEAADVPPASEDRTLEERVARVWLRRILAQDTPRAHGAQSRR